MREKVLTAMIMFAATIVTILIITLGTENIINKDQTDFISPSISDSRGGITCSHQ